MNKMEAKKIFIIGLGIFGLICVSSFILAGFTRKESVSQLQQEPLNLQVDVLRQSRSTSCGEAVIVMAYNYAYVPTTVTEQEVIDYAVAQGYFTEGVPPFTSPANMMKIAGYYADDIAVGTVHSAGSGLSLLMKKLQSGIPIIIDVLSNFDDPGSEAHFIVITGISVDQNRGDAIVIHYNDPLTGTRESADWSGESGVWNAWQNNGDPGGSGWWLVIPPP